MPLPHYDCPQTEVVCCTTVYDIAETVMTTLLAEVNACIAAHQCSEEMIEGIVMHGEEGQRPTSDYLAVWVAGIGPSALSADRRGSMGMPIMRGTYGVRLLESGYPMPSTVNGQIVLPSAEAVKHATDHSTSHGERMFRAFTSMLRTQSVNGCGFQSVSQLVPIPPSGGSVGWQFSFTVGLDW